MCLTNRPVRWSYNGWSHSATTSIYSGVSNSRTEFLIARYVDWKPYWDWKSHISTVIEDGNPFRHCIETTTSLFSFTGHLRTVYVRSLCSTTVPFFWRVQIAFILAAKDNDYRSVCRLNIILLWVMASI